MTADWSTVCWGDIATLRYGKALQGYDQKPAYARVYGTNGPIGWTDQALSEPPGIIVGRKGAYRGVHFSDQPFWVIDTAYFLQPKIDLNWRWAYYQLLSVDLNKIDDGSPIPSTTRPDFYAIPVRLPPREEQDIIAEVLATLDRKIELNRCIAATLNEQVRSIFRRWFVDFDLTQLGAEKTASPKSTAELAHDELSFEEVPEGWSKQSIAGVADITKGAPYKSEHLDPAARTALVTLKSFQRGGGYRTDGLKPFSGPFKDAQRVRAGELVVAATDVTQAAEIVGQPVIVPYSKDFDTLVGSLDTFILRPKIDALSPAMLEGILRANFFPSFARGYCTGTTVLHLSRQVFDDFGIAIPPENALQAMQECLAPLFGRIDNCRTQSETLSQLRDTLLPKLIAGEFRIAAGGKRVVAA